MRVKHTFTNPIPDRVGFPGVQPSHWNADHTIEGEYATRTAAAAATISSSVDYLRTAGYSEAGDGGGALYKRVSSEPSHAGKFQSADGAWFEYAEVTVDVRKFGATGDATTDDTTAITNAIAYAKALDEEATLYFPDGQYKVTDTIDVDGGKINVYMDAGARLLYAGTADKVILDFSASASRRHHVGLAVENDTTHSYDDEDFIGIRFASIANSFVEIRLVWFCTVSMRLRGVSTGAGISYNTFLIGDLLDAVHHIDIRTEGANGYVNSNKFFGGRYGNSSSFPAGSDSFGITMRGDGTNNYANNNNVFDEPHFELQNGNSGVERCPWQVIDGNGIFNVIKWARVETGRGPIAKFTSSTESSVTDYSAYNKFEILDYVGVQGDPTPEISGNYSWGNQVIMEGFAGKGTMTVVAGLNQRAFAPTSTTVCVPGLFWWTAGTNTEALASSSGRIRYDYVELAAAGAMLGFILDTSKCKSWKFERDFVDGFCGRPVYVPLDANGVPIQYAGSGQQDVWGPGISAATTGSVTRYQTGTDIQPSHVFSVSSATKYVKVMVWGGSSGARLKALAISPLIYLTSISTTALNITEAVGISAGVWGEPSNRFCNDNPATARNGGWVQPGMAYFNSEGASAEAAMWIATGQGFNATAWASSTAYIVGAMVENDTGKVYRCITAGTSNSSGGPTGTGSSAITDGTCEWLYVGALPTFIAGPAIP